MEWRSKSLFGAVIPAAATIAFNLLQVTIFRPVGQSPIKLEAPMFDISVGCVFAIAALCASQNAKKASSAAAVCLSLVLAILCIDFIAPTIFNYDKLSMILLMDIISFFSLAIMIVMAG